MPVFATPEPISVTIDLSVGDVRLVASDRTDTVVEVRPSDESDDSDVQAAQQTRVEYANGTLTVRGPKSRAFDFSKKSRSVTVVVELSAFRADEAPAAVQPPGAHVRLLGPELDPVVAATARLGDRAVDAALEPAPGVGTATD